MPLLVFSTDVSALSVYIFHFGRLLVFLVHSSALSTISSKTFLPLFRLHRYISKTSGFSWLPDQMLQRHTREEIGDRKKQKKEIMWRSRRSSQAADSKTCSDLQLVRVAQPYSCEQASPRHGVHRTLSCSSEMLFSFSLVLPRRGGVCLVLYENLVFYIDQ